MTEHPDVDPAGSTQELPVMPPQDVRRPPVVLPRRPDAGGGPLPDGATEAWPAATPTGAPEDPPTRPVGAHTPPAPAGTGRGQHGMTVRTRILAVVLALSALAMLAAGGTASLLQRERVDVRIDESLARSVEEFRTLAADGVDPATGAGFTSVRSLLYTALQRTVPSRNEGMLAVLDGRLELVAPSAVVTRLEDAPGLVDAAVAAQGDDAVRLRTLVVGDRSYRYVVVPVTVVGDPAPGALVVGFDRTAEHEENARTYRTFALVGAGALVVVGVVGWVLAGRLLRPVRLLGETARRITDSDLGERIPVSGDDDVSAVARTVNSMLDRLEAAFGSQRRLLDDAGHELRTPLTIVRGHLELMDPDDPDDVRATQDLVLDEVDRMHGLVDDLVTLATTDRPDFVQPVPTDVGRLTDDVLDKARTLGSRHWRVDARADVVASLDPARVTQAWLQLAANAVKFSPDGSTVHLGSRLAGDRVLLSVRDEGPGIAADDAERVFERFARGTAGRGVEGSGLGLPIVRAIARAHHGDVRVVEPGSPGGHVVIDLPLRDLPRHEPDHADGVDGVYGVDGIDDGVPGPPGGTRP